jgi:hypothetical protein
VIVAKMKILFVKFLLFGVVLAANAAVDGVPNEVNNSQFYQHFTIITHTLLLNSYCQKCDTQTTVQKELVKCW